MRILHLIHRYYPGIGGAETHFGRISEYLAAQGHDVTVVTSDAADFERFWNPKARRVATATEVHNGVRIQRFPIRHLPGSRLTFPALRHTQAALSRFPVVTNGVLSRLSRLAPPMPDLWQWAQTTDEPFDLVAAMTVTLEGFFGAGQRLAKRLGVPFVIYPLAHLGAGIKPGHDALSRFYTMRHQTNLVVHADHLFAQTQTEADFYVSHGLEREKITIAGPGVDPDKIGKGNGERFRERYSIEGDVVLCVGRVSAEKGITHALEAMIQLWNAGSNAELILIGTLTPEAQQIIKTAGTLPKLHALGRIDEQTKRDALAAAAVVAMPSRTDSFGIVYLEAWVHARPVIAAQTWGVTDLVQHEVNGLVVPFGDVEAIRASLHRILTNPALAEKLGTNGYRQTVQNHTWSQKLKTIEMRYRTLTNS